MEGGHLPRLLKGLGIFSMILFFVRYLSIYPALPYDGIPSFAHVVENNETRPYRSLSPMEEDGANIVFTIRTTVSLHKKRLPLLMETWMTKVNCSRIYLVTDGPDRETEEKAKALGMHYHVINCGKTYERDDLCCKSGSELIVIFLPGNEHYDWHCHVDDDIYVNLKPLVKLLSKFDPKRESIYLGRSGHRGKVHVGPNSNLGPDLKHQYFLWAYGGTYCMSRPMLEEAKPFLVGGENFARSCHDFQQPEDVTVGSVIGALLGRTLTGTNLINPHCLYLDQDVDSNKLKEQAAIAYGYGMLRFSSNPYNVVIVPDALYTTEEDGSQFRSLHCHIYPETPWCIEKREDNKRKRNAVSAVTS